MYVIEDAVFDKYHKNPVYIILSHSDTILGNAIVKVTKFQWSHASIAFNSKLDPLYSFGAREESKSGIGFAVMKHDDEFYKDYKTPYAVYALFITDKAKKAIKDRLNYFINNADKLKYDFSGIIKNYFNKESTKDDAYFCTRFVMDLLSNAIDLDKGSSLYRPKDISNLDCISLVNDGDDLAKYDYKITDNNIQKIKDGTFTTIRESVSNNTYYHISRHKLKVISPKIPDNYLTRNGFEDNKIARVCVTPDIEHCLMAHTNKQPGDILYIYEIKADDVYKPTIDQLPSVNITNEYWILRQVEANIVGKIKVLEPKLEEAKKYMYTNERYITIYPYNYEKVETVKEEV